MELYTDKRSGPFKIDNFVLFFHSNTIKEYFSNKIGIVYIQFQVALYQQNQDPKKELHYCQKQITKILKTEFLFFQEHLTNVQISSMLVFQGRFSLPI